MCGASSSSRMRRTRAGARFRRWNASAALSDCTAIDKNAVENEICPVALGRKNWLFAGTNRRAAILSLIESDQTERPRSVRLSQECASAAANHLYRYLDPLLPFHQTPEPPARQNTVATGGSPDDFSAYIEQVSTLSHELYRGDPRLR